MKNTKNRNSEVKWSRRTAALLALAAGLGFASCGEIVDSDGSQTTTQAPEANVKNFYYQIEHKDAEYRYALTSKNAYLPEADVLVMQMEGYEYPQSWKGMPVCTCDWGYEKTSGQTPWYYYVSADSVVGLGVLLNGQYTDSWVELKAPLQKDASWKFTSDGELITAKITRYGVSATVGGKTFKDVLVVEYKGEKGTDGTTWFQRDTGVIYSHLSRPGDMHIDLQFKSMKDNQPSVHLRKLTNCDLPILLVVPLRDL